MWSSFPFRANILSTLFPNLSRIAASYLAAFGCSSLFSLAMSCSTIIPDLLPLRWLSLIEHLYGIENQRLKRLQNIETHYDKENYQNHHWYDGEPAHLNL